MEDQFYLTLPFVLLFIARVRHSAIVVPALIVFGGFALRWFLAVQNLGESGVNFWPYQTWIYYATWTRLDPLVFGVALAAIEKFRASWWQRLMKLAPWLGLAGLGLIVCAFVIEDREMITVASCVWQFPLVALGMSGLLVAALSARLPFTALRLPGVAFVASIAYSAYLVQKLVIHFALRFCEMHHIATTSPLALIGVQVCIYLVATLLFLAVERPFLILRHRIAARPA